MRLAARLSIFALLAILSGPVAFAQDALNDGSSIHLLDVQLDVVHVPPSPGPLKITQQIRFGGRVLLQADKPFAIIGRAMSDAAELIVLRAGTAWACGEWDARRQPTAEDLRGLPIEYHPPAESWPREALEVLRTSFCRKE